MTASVNLSAPLVQKFWDNAGNVASGCKLFTYGAGTNTKQATYTDSSGTVPCTNPILLDATGSATFWPDTSLTYKFVLAPANDTDPPTSPIWTRDGVQTPANTASAAAAAAAAAQPYVDAASTSATSAAGSATASAASSNAAAAAAATAGAYPNSAASNVPRGLTQASVGAITAGSGGTNGTFALAWSSGNFSINPTGTFTVAGGVVTAVTITGPGLYIGSSPTVPTPSFAASAGLAGAAVALTAQFLVPSGQQGYWVTSADGKTLDHYQNVAGVATADTTVASIAANGVVLTIALTSGAKKYKSLVPLDAYGDSAFCTSASFLTQNVLVQATDLVYKSLGVKVEFPGTSANSVQVRSNDVVATLDSMWVTFGYIARDANASWQTSSIFFDTATNKSDTAGVAHNLPTSANKKFIDLDSTHRLFYAQVQMAVGSNGKYLIAYDSASLAAIDFVAAPFLFVTATQPSLFDLDIFPGERGSYAQDYAAATISLPLTDSIGQPLVGNNDFSLSNLATTATVTDAEVLQVLPTGSVISLPANTFGAIGEFNLTAVAGLLNQYPHASVYAYSQNGDFTGFGVTFFFRNGTSNVVITALDDTVRYTQISANLRRYDFIGQFRVTWATYGAAAQGSRTANVGPATPIYLFAFMATVQSTPHLSQYIQPTGWAPKNQVVRGFQAASFSTVTTTPWTGKKIVWMGTSIPNGGGYPAAICSALGATIADITLSGGHIAAFQNSGAMWQQNLIPSMFSLEAADITAWAGANIGFEVNPTDYSTRQPGSGTVLTQAMLNALIVNCYEAKLIPNYDADLFVFDYGINDSSAVSTTAAASGTNRSYFAGATQYIWNKIRTYKRTLPKNFQAVILTHHNRALSSQPHGENDVVTRQLDVAQFLGLPCINVADNLGINLTNVTDYTNDGGAYHFSPGSDLYLRYVQYVTAKLKEIH